MNPTYNRHFEFIFIKKTTDEIGKVLRRLNRKAIYKRPITIEKLLKKPKAKPLGEYP